MSMWICTDLHPGRPKAIRFSSYPLDVSGLPPLKVKENGAMSWECESKTIGDRFVALSGDEGEKILIFRAEPTEHQSNFDDRKLEYRFPAYEGTLKPENGSMAWEPVLVTESGENFRASLTKFIRAMHWGTPCVVTWKKRKASSGRFFKDFRIVPIKAPNLPAEA